MIPYYILAIEDESDREFMEELFENYNRLMYREIQQYVVDDHAVEDILQSTLVSLIDKVKELRLKGRDSLVNYIITACRNRAKNYLRDKSRHEEVPLDDYWNQGDPENDRIVAEYYLTHEAELNGLAKIWPRLDEKSRRILEERYILKKTFDEMAEERGIKPASVRMALSRAKKNAYRLLEAEFGPV